MSELKYTTSVTANMMIMQAINQELQRQEFERLAPLIRDYLEQHGVIFPEVQP